MDAKVRGIVVPSAMRSHIGLAPLHGSWSFGGVEELLVPGHSDRARAVILMILLDTNLVADRGAG